MSPSASGNEREIKISGVDLTGLEAGLRDAGGREVCAAHWERNWVLDREGALFASQRLLRIREQRGVDGTLIAAWMTVKAPLPAEAQAAAERAGVKERFEQEIPLDRAKDGLELMALLGYQPERRYDKIRCAFDLDGHEVALDRTPIGDFAEIEGADPRRVATALGLDLKKVELASYLALYDRFRSAHPQLGHDMVFREGPSADRASPRDTVRATFVLATLPQEFEAAVSHAE